MASQKHSETMPVWLDESFFRDIFEGRDDLRDKDFQLQVLQAGSLVSAGENFCAQMYGVKVQCKCEGRQEVANFIVKTGKNNVEFLKEQNVFGTEFEMYRTVIKSFEEMWVKIGEPVSFGPKCLKIVHGETDVLVLSDLKEEGFEMMDRLEGLNEEATRLVLDKIAKFHAASVSFKEQMGKFGPLISRKLFTPKTFDQIMKFQVAKVKSLVQAAQEWKFDARITQVIEGWADLLAEETIATTDPDTAQNDFQVLCHGDLWVNNMMFRTDKETRKATDVILIDFQLSYWNRPEGDLFYFLLSSVKTEILLNRFDHFLQFYHEKLLGALQKLNVKQQGPSLKAFQMQLLKNSFHIPRALVGVLPIILMDKSDALSLEDLLGDASKEKVAKMDRSMFYNPRMESKMRNLLPFFYNRGMLDSALVRKDLNGNQI